jgi:hypothetical protein
VVTRKLNAIECLIQPQDEDVFKEIEEIFYKTKDS